MIKLLTFIVVVVLCIAKSGCVSPSSEFRHGMSSLPVSETEVESKQSMFFPCDVDFSKPHHDSPVIVLIFYNNARQPFASVDYRDFEHRIYISEAFKDRLVFTEGDQVKQFRLDYVKPSDEGIYTCRVDYYYSPSKIKKIHLKVVEPIHKLSIRVREENGVAFEATNVIGPYLEGTKLFLACKALGGNRIANITWWYNGQLMPNQEKFTNINVLTIEPLSIGDRYKTVTCKARNSNFTTEIESSVTIDVQVPPRGVRITSDKSYVEPNRGPKIVTIREGERLKLDCQVLLSDSEIEIVWEKESATSDPLISENILGEHVAENRSNNRSQNSSAEIQFSRIVLRPTYLDNGSLIRCKAFNSIYPKQETEDVIQLNVLYFARLTLTSRGNNLQNLQAGDDLYLDCHVSANPPVSNVEWTKNDQVVNSSSETLITSSLTSLIVQQVTSATSGIYQCSVGYSEGIEYSNPLDIQVKGVPECKNQSITITADLDTTIELICDVFSYPPALNFKWNYATKRSTSNRLPSKTSNNAINYDVRKPSDFKTILCRTENTVGKMIYPCALIVSPTGKPQKIKDCDVIRNIFEVHFRYFVKCKHGWDGGFKQMFNMEVYDQDRRTISPLFNISSDRATFEITNMIATTFDTKIYVFNISSFNSKGRTNPISITFPKLINQNTRTKSLSQSSMSNLSVFLSSTQIIAITLGVIITLSISLIVVVCSLKCGYWSTAKKSVDYSSWSDEEDSFMDRKSLKSSSIVNDGTFQYTNFKHADYVQCSGRLVIGVNSKRTETSTNQNRKNNIASKNLKQEPKIEHLYDVEEYKSNLKPVEKFHKRRIPNFEENSNLQEKDSTTLTSSQSFTNYSEASIDGTISVQTVLLNPEFNTENDGIIV